MGAFSCIYIVLAYLGAGWNCATPLQADTAMWFVHEAQLPWRIQNVESRPPLLPKPAVVCKPQQLLENYPAAARPWASPPLRTAPGTTHVGMCAGALATVAK